MTLVSRFLFLAMCAAAALHCNESLPPHDQPVDYLQIQVHMSPRQIYVEYGWVPTWIKLPSGRLRYTAVYMPTRVDNSYIAVSVYNRYVEVLQDSADVHGTLELWDTDRPSLHVTIDLRKALLRPYPTQPGHLLTLGPDSAAVLSTSWNSLSDTIAATRKVSWFWDGVNSTPSIERDSRGFYRTVNTTDPVHLSMRVTIQLFARTGRTVSPVIPLDVVYTIHPPWNDPHRTGARPDTP